MPLPGPAIYYYVSPAGSNPIHGFIKKTAKTPKKELETALNRYQEWLDR